MDVLLPTRTSAPLAQMAPVPALLKNDYNSNYLQNPTEYTAFIGVKEIPIRTL